MYWFDHFYVSLGFLFCQKRVVLTIFLKTLQLSQSHLPWFSFHCRGGFTEVRRGIPPLGLGRDDTLLLLF